MTDRAWKRQERRVATMLGSHRNPNNGESRTDIDAGPFGIEHKMRRKLPAWLTDAMGQAARASSGEQTPLVILTAVSRGRKAERYVLWRFCDFVEWHGDGQEAAFG